MSGQRISGERAWRRVRRVLTIAQPAAGADWSATVPAGVLWRVEAARAVLTTDATVANRIPRYRVTLPEGIVAELPVTVAVTASLATPVTCFSQGTTSAGDIYRVIRVPDWWLPPATVFGMATASLQAADQWSAVLVYLTETLYHRGPEDIGSVPDFLVELATPVAAS